MPVEDDAALAVIIRNDNPVVPSYSTVDSCIVAIDLVYDKLVPSVPKIIDIILAEHTSAPHP